jgi:hypothetical protein
MLISASTKPPSRNDDNGSSVLTGGPQESWDFKERWSSSGNVTDEVWKKYIEDQKPETPDDSFKVV